jgi:hypothetical protein
MKNKTSVIIILACTPILFFIGSEIFSPESDETVKSKIISSIIIGYTASIGLWLFIRRGFKKQKR